MKQDNCDNVPCLDKENPIRFATSLIGFPFAFFLNFDGQTLQSPSGMEMCFQGSDHWYYQSVIRYCAQQNC